MSWASKMLLLLPTCYSSSAEEIAYFGITPGTEIYVDASAGPGPGDGTTWTMAFIKLQDALLIAQPCDTICVAKGIYFPDEGTGIADND